MTQVQSKGDGKASSAVLVGVGVAAGAAVLHSADASVSSEIDQTSSGMPRGSALTSVIADETMAGKTPVVAAQVFPNTPATESATNIEQLVDAYLSEHADEGVSVEVLSEAELQDHLSESELQSLLSQPGVQVAQGGGGGGGFGFLGGGGFPPGAMFGGMALGGYALNELLDDDESNGTV